jgi:Uncharacterized conserved protein
MNRRAVVAIILLGALISGVAIQQGIVTGYEETTVTIQDGDTGAQLVTADVRVADTVFKQYIGLSNTDSLGTTEGMLFVHESSDRRAYVMRGMSFPIEIIFVNAAGEITTIHQAQPGDDYRFEGDGKFVLEVRLGFTDAFDIAVGDEVIVDR